MQVTVFGYIHSVANGLVTITRNNDDANKVFVSSTDVVLTPDMSTPRRAAIQMDKGLATAYGLYREPPATQTKVIRTDPRTTPPGSPMTQSADSELDVKLDSSELTPDHENQPTAAEMAARLSARNT